MLLLDEGHCLRDQALALCAEAGAHETEDVRATSLHTLVRLVAAGLGVTLLPALARDEAAGERVQLRPFRDPAPGRTLALAWRTSSARAGDFLLLAETLRAALPEGVTARD